MASKFAEPENTRVKRRMSDFNDGTTPKQYRASKRILKVILLGLQGAGKAAFVNNIAQALTKSDKPCRPCIAPCYSPRTSGAFTIELSNCTLRVVLTPGFANPNISEDDLCDELEKSVDLAEGISPSGIDAFFLVLRPEPLIKEHKTMCNAIEKIFGESVFKHMMLVFTCKDLLEEEGSSVSQYLESVRDCTLKRIMRKVHNRHICVNNKHPCENQTRMIEDEILSFVAIKDAVYDRQ